MVDEGSRDEVEGGGDDCLEYREGYVVAEIYREYQSTGLCKRDKD